MTFPKCAATNCRMRGRFRFPKNEQLRRLWVEAIGRQDFIPSNYSVLCESHFLPEDIIQVNKYGIELLRLQLREAAIPRIFKNVGHQSEHEEGEDEDEGIDDEEEEEEEDDDEDMTDDEGDYLRPEHLLKIEIQEEEGGYDFQNLYKQAIRYHPAQEVVTRTRRPYPFTCDVCLKRFRNTPMLERHKERHSPTAIKMKKDESKCEFCQKNFCNKYYLKQHLSIHKRKMKLTNSEEHQGFEQSSKS